MVYGVDRMEKRRHNVIESVQQRLIKRQLGSIQPTDGSPHHVANLIAAAYARAT